MYFTQVPGTYFSSGSHQIVYEAYDLAGYSTKCTFKIIVNVPKFKKFYHQLPMYNFNTFL